MGIRHSVMFEEILAILITEFLILSSVVKTGAAVGIRLHVIFSFSHDKCYKNCGCDSQFYFFSPH